MHLLLVPWKGWPLALLLADSVVSFAHDGPEGHSIRNVPPQTGISGKSLKESSQFGYDGFARRTVASGQGVKQRPFLHQLLPWLVNNTDRALSPLQISHLNRTDTDEHSKLHHAHKDKDREHGAKKYGSKHPPSGGGKHATSTHSDSRHDGVRAHHKDRPGSAKNHHNKHGGVEHHKAKTHGSEHSRVKHHKTKHQGIQHDEVKHHKPKHHDKSKYHGSEHKSATRTYTSHHSAGHGTKGKQRAGPSSSRNDLQPESPALSNSDDSGSTAVAASFLSTKKGASETASGSRVPLLTHSYATPAPPAPVADGASMPVSADAPADGAGSEAHEGEAGPTASDTSSSVPAEGDIQPDEKPPADAPLAPLPGSPSVPSTAEVPSEANPANLPSAQNQPAPPEISFPVALQYPAGDMHSARVSFGRLLFAKAFPAASSAIQNVNQNTGDGASIPMIDAKDVEPLSKVAALAAALTGQIALFGLLPSAAAPAPAPVPAPVPPAPVAPDPTIPDAQESGSGAEATALDPAQSSSDEADWAEPVPAVPGATQESSAGADPSVPEPSASDTTQESSTGEEPAAPPTAVPDTPDPPAAESSDDAEPIVPADESDSFGVLPAETLPSISSSGTTTDPSTPPEAAPPDIQSGSDAVAEPDATVTPAEPPLPAPDQGADAPSPGSSDSGDEAIEVYAPSEAAPSESNAGEDSDPTAEAPAPAPEVESSSDAGSGASSDEGSTDSEVPVEASAPVSATDLTEDQIDSLVGAAGDAASAALIDAISVLDPEAAEEDISSISGAVGDAIAEALHIAFAPTAVSEGSGSAPETPESASDSGASPADAAPLPDSDSPPPPPDAASSDGSQPLAESDGAPAEEEPEPEAEADEPNPEEEDAE